MASVAHAPVLPEPVPDIAEMREAAMALAMRGHLTYVEDAPDESKPWLANAGDTWEYVDASAVEEFYAHPATQERVTEMLCVMAEAHYQRTMARLEEWRGKYPAAFMDELEPFVRARAELNISRGEFNGVAAHLWEKHAAEAALPASDGPWKFFAADDMLSDERGAF
jgi:hypothetical protein